MTRRLLTLASAVLTAFGVVVMTAMPAHAATNRTVSVSGTLQIVDHETDRADEMCLSSINTNRTAASAYPIPLEWIKTCGGEIRVETHMDVQVTSNNSLRITGSSLFYEGTTEATADLDGSKDFTLTVAPGATVPLTLTVWNTDEGDCDCAYLNLRISNTKD